MILEVAPLDIRPGMASQFEQAFAKAQHIIASMPGYVRHSLQKCIENDHRYLLLVEWRELRDHTEGFRGSAQYSAWRKLLHHFYDPFPVVEHYELLQLPDASAE